MRRALALAALALLMTTSGATAALDVADPPITYTLTGTTGTNGWWRSNVTVHWVVQPTETLVSTTGCEPAVLVVGDVSGAQRTCSAEWSDGSKASLTTSMINIDKTPPTVSGTPSRAPNAAGWYKAPVTVSFDGTDAMSGLNAASCTSSQYGGPDDATATVNGTCKDNAGNTGNGSVQLAYDATPPAVASATPERAPDVDPWYNAPVTFAITDGGDNLSGVQSCPSVLYSGPDAADADFAAHCVDKAGNVGTGHFTLDYDATGPSVQAVPGRPPDRYGWYSHNLRVQFMGTDGVSGVASALCEEEIYGGPSSADASLTGSCTDNAGNTRNKTFTFKYAEPFMTPKSGLHVSTPPLLNWPNVPKASLYNVQLWHNGKMLSRWPVRSRWQLTKKWRFNGRTYRLEPGRYTWYVWPRIGGHYRKLVGRSVFYVTAG